MFEIEFSFASYNSDIFLYCATNISVKIFFIYFIESLSIEINEMKWIRGIPCRYQSAKLSV